MTRRHRIGTRAAWRRACALGAGGLIVLCSNLALADGPGYQETQSGQDQSVIFKDDPLAAGGFGPNDVILRVPPTPKRVMLLRPRTQFVPELLKTVESL